MGLSWEWDSAPLVGPFNLNRVQMATLIRSYTPQIILNNPILATGLLAGLIAAATCQAQKRVPSGVLPGIGVGGLAAALAWLARTLGDPSLIPDLLTGAVDQALAAAESLARGLGLDLLADAMGRARSLFNDLKEWADRTLGQGGRLLLGLFLIYLVYQRFFLRR